MIAQLRGKIIETNTDKDFLQIVIDVQGVGYEVLMSKASQVALTPGLAATLYICESVTAFDGATTLYGFLKREEKDLFVRIRENVDGMGPKKALECMDKINKSLPDFRRAIIDGDMKLLVSVFGFTKKTAEKLVFALRGEASGWLIVGAPKWVESSHSREEFEAVSGLVNLGYAEEEAREAVKKAKSSAGHDAATEILLKEALKTMGARLS